MSNIIRFKPLVERVIRRARRAKETHKIMERAVVQASLDPALINAFALISHFYDHLATFEASDEEVPDIRVGSGRPSTGKKNVQELCRTFFERIVPKWKKPKKILPMPTPMYEAVFEPQEEKSTYTFNFNK